MSWLGLDLAPDTPIKDLLQSIKEKSNNKPVAKSFDWFLKSESFPVDAVACQKTYQLEDKLHTMMNRLDIESIEKTLGYKFEEKTFVIQAFTHASYSPNKLTDSYEQLEVSSCFTFIYCE